MLINELRNRALSIVQIPDHLHPFIEDYVEKKHGEGEAMFCWANESQDEDITVNLGSKGNLLRLSINVNGMTHSEGIPLTLNQKKECAERFLLSHYPNALEYFTFINSKTLTQVERFYFEQIIMGLPLDRAGCYIDVDVKGSIVGFTYDGVQSIPEIPSELVSKEKLLKDVQNRLDMQLTIANLYTNIYDIEKDELRLVYEPKQTFLKYQAADLEPTLTIIHDEEYEETYIPISPPKNPIVNVNLTIEDVIGITKGMEVLRKVDMGDELGIVWCERGNEMKATDLSMDGFFKNRTENTVKAFISKNSGRIRSFIWFAERNGPLELSREECYENAINFLEVIIPDFMQYLSLLVVDDEDSDDASGNKESFTFRIHNCKGIPFHSELVIVVVNRLTGLIDYYNGPSIEIEELRQVPNTPTISKLKASEIYLNHIDFELEWDINVDNEIEFNTLIYRGCNRISKTPIRYIDAVTGAIISDKN